MKSTMSKIFLASLLFAGLHAGDLSVAKTERDTLLKVLHSTSAARAIADGQYMRTFQQYGKDEQHPAVQLSKNAWRAACQAERTASHDFCAAHDAWKNSK